VNDRHTYHDIEDRCFPFDDFWLGPSQLMAAMVADDKIAELWEQGDFDTLDPQELEAAHLLTFNRTKARTLALGHRLVWDICIEYIPNPERTHTS
jgi:hypothetical protein